MSDARADLFVPPDHRKLGMVFQSYAIWPHMTVFDNVAYPLSVRRRQAEICDGVAAALRLVEMDRFADRPALAPRAASSNESPSPRALVFEPEVLLLDEPLSNPMQRLRTQMGDEFRALQRRLNITTLGVTHDQDEAMALSDRVVVMARRILQADAPEAVYRRPASRDVAAFFGTPNLIDTKVIACRTDERGVHTLTVEGAGGRGECRAGRAFPVGESVLVVVRPEDVTLSAQPTPGSQRPPRLDRSCRRGRVPRLPSVVDRRCGGLAAQRRMPGDARCRGRRNGDAAGRRRQRLGAERLSARSFILLPSEGGAPSYGAEGRDSGDEPRPLRRRMTAYLPNFVGEEKRLTPSLRTDCRRRPSGA